jgi:hypothetical protein
MSTLANIEKTEPVYELEEFIGMDLHGNLIFEYGCSCGEDASECGHWDGADCE